MNAPVLALERLRMPLVVLRIDAHERRRVDLRALAAPLFVNSTIQAVLSLTGTWFIGRLSTDATNGRRERSREGGVTRGAALAAGRYAASSTRNRCTLGVTARALSLNVSPPGIASPSPTPTIT
ncbi:MAG: hypothetical protein WCA12_14460, partial [Burkholderiales bacterium]